MTNSKNLMLVQEVLDNLIPYAWRTTLKIGRQSTSKVIEMGLLRFLVVLCTDRIMAVVRFSVIQNLDLSYDVLYEEWPMEDDVLIYARTVVPFLPPLVLFHSVATADFQYFGWKDRVSKAGNGGDQLPQAPSWHKELNAVASTVAPVKVSWEVSL